MTGITVLARVSVTTAALALLLACGIPLCNAAAGCRPGPPPAAITPRNLSEANMSVEAIDQANVEWGKAVKGLRLGLTLKGTTATFYLENTGDTPITVLSHVIGGEEDHLDFFTAHLTDAKGGEQRTLRFLGNREESEVVKVPLAPGKSLHHVVDLAVWARRGTNGAKPLAPGDYELKVVYEAQPRNGNWTGRLEAGPIPLKVAAP